MVTNERTSVHAELPPLSTWNLTYAHEVIDHIFIYSLCCILNNIYWKNKKKNGHNWNKIVYWSASKMKLIRFWLFCFTSDKINSIFFLFSVEMEIVVSTQWLWRVRDGLRFRWHWIEVRPRMSTFDFSSGAVGRFLNRFPSIFTLAISQGTQKINTEIHAKNVFSKFSLSLAGFFFQFQIIVLNFMHHKIHCFLLIGVLVGMWFYRLVSL